MSLIQQLDIFGYQAKLYADRQQKTHKTKLGVCFSVFYFVMVIVIIVSCIQPSISDLSDDVKEEREDEKKKMKRNLAELPASSVFTQEPFLVAESTSAKTNEQIGIFIFVQDDAESHIHYDDEFKKYATLEYIEKDNAGKEISSGEFKECDSATYKEFYKLPQLSVVDFDDIFCPPIDIASQIQKGNIEIQIKKCDPTKNAECKAEYTHFKFFGTKTFSTGVAYNKPYVSDNKLVMVPEVTISNKFTIVDTLHITQDLHMIMNQYQEESFFNFDIKFPKAGQVQSSLSPLLVFHQSFSLNPIGNKYSFSQIVNPSNIQTALNEVETKAVANDQTLQTELEAKLKTVETKAVANDQTLQTELEAKLKTVETKAVANDQTVKDELEAKLNEVETKAVTNDQTLQDELEAKLKTLETKAVANDQTLQTELEAKLKTIDTTLQKVQSKEVATPEDLGKLETKLVAVETKSTTGMDKLTATMATMDLTLQKVQSKEVATPEDVGNLEKKISAVETASTATSASLTKFQGEYEIHEKKLQAADSATEDALAKFQGEYAAHEKIFEAADHKTEDALAKFQGEYATDQKKLQTTDTGFSEDHASMKAMIKTHHASMKTMQDQIAKLEAMNSKIAQIDLVDKKLTALSKFVSSHEDEGHDEYTQEISKLKDEFKKAEAAQKAEDAQKSEAALKAEAAYKAEAAQKAEAAKPDQPVQPAQPVQNSNQQTVVKTLTVKEKGDIRQVFLDLGSATGLCILLYFILHHIIAGYQEFSYNVDLVQKLYWYRWSYTNLKNETLVTQEDGFETNREMIPKGRTESQTPLKEGGEMEIEMEGGQLINKTETYKLRSQVNQEIDTHQKLKLTEFEIFCLYSVGCCMYNEYGKFVKEGISRLQHRVTLKDMIKDVQDSKVAIQASVVKDGFNNFMLQHARQNVIAEDDVYNEAPQVFDNSVDSTLSQLVINQSQDFHTGDHIREYKPKQFAKLSEILNKTQQKGDNFAKAFHALRFYKQVQQWQKKNLQNMDGDSWIKSEQNVVFQNGQQVTFADLDSQPPTRVNLTHIVENDRESAVSSTVAISVKESAVHEVQQMNKYLGSNVKSQKSDVFMMTHGLRSGKFARIDENDQRKIEKLPQTQQRQILETEVESMRGSILQPDVSPGGM